MSNINEKGITKAAAESGEPVVLTPEDLVKQLRALRAQLPLPPQAVKRVGSTPLGGVNPDFVQAAVNAAGASEVVTGALGRTAVDLQAEIDTAARWTAAAMELRSLLRELLAGNIARRQRLGLAALQTYQICQQLSRDEQHSVLEAHVAEMRRLNRFGRPRRKPEPETPSTPPATPTPPGPKLRAA